jgi:hypothetical protein
MDHDFGRRTHSLITHVRAPERRLGPSRGVRFTTSVKVNPDPPRRESSVNGNATVASSVNPVPFESTRRPRQPNPNGNAARAAAAVGAAATPPPLSLPASPPPPPPLPAAVSQTPPRSITSRRQQATTAAASRRCRAALCPRARCTTAGPAATFASRAAG